ATVAGDVDATLRRVGLRGMVIVERAFLARGMPRVDDEHVCPLGQALDNFCRVRRFEINRYPTLVAIVQVPHVGILGLRLRRNLVPILHYLPLGGSTLITSATESGRITAAPCPATEVAKSTTFRPGEMVVGWFGV